MTQPINTYGRHHYERNGDAVAFLAQGQWAAYEPTERSRRHGWSSETIVALGAKLPYAEARVMFPKWDAHYEWRR